MKADPTNDSKSSPRIDAGLICLFCLLLIAPLKFGAIIGTGGIPLFPLSIVEWIFGIWPPVLAAALAGLCLLVVAVIHRDALPEQTFAGWFPVLPAAILLLGAIPGFIGTTEWATAVPLIWHFLSVVAIAAAAHIQISASPASIKWLLLAIVAGGIMCCWGTIEQVIWGFERTREAVEAMIKSGHRVPGPLLSRATQTRAFAYFTYPNNLAAHFLVAIPIMLAAAHRFGRNIEPKKVSAILLPILTLIVAAWCFIQTDSLGGTVAIGGAIGGVLALRLLNSKRKGSGSLFLILIIASSAIAGILASRNAGRLKSVGARFEYYRCASLMTAQQPVTGVGWGEFYPWYMRMKQKGAEETRMPHNLLLSFSSQAGLLGAAAALLFLLQPFWLTWFGKRMNWQLRPFWHLPIALSLFGWFTHSLADFNLMIPGTLLTIAALSPMLLARTESKAKTEPKPTPFWLPALGGLIVASALWMLPGERAYQDLEVALRSGNIPLARKHLKRASALLPHSPHPDDTYARAMGGRQAWPEAAEHWQVSVSRAPHRSGFHLRLAEIYVNAGDYPAAEAALKRAEEWYPHSKNLNRIRQQLAEKQNAPTEP